MPRQRKIPDHVVMRTKPANPGDPSNRCRLSDTASMACERCGETMAMPLGPVAWVLAVMNGFGAEHRNCKPR